MCGGLQHRRCRYVGGQMLDRFQCTVVLWATGGLNSFVERWSIYLGGGRPPGIRAGRQGRRMCRSTCGGPCSFSARTNGACPSSANPLICGANRTIITGCTHKPRAPSSSCNTYSSYSFLLTLLSFPHPFRLSALVG